MKPSTHFFRTIIKNPLQKMSTASHETTSGSGTAMAALKSILQVPTWSLVGLGTAAAGFFGKMLHDDNLATRAELQTTTQQLHDSTEGLRKELHDTVKELREDNKALRAEMNSHIKELRAEMNAHNKELREDNKELRAEMNANNKESRAEMNAGFQKINEAIANLSHGPK